jgi:SAM-dependent methyltransferase
MFAGMIDWGAGNYERTAKELESVAQAVVEEAGLLPGECVVDLACGTGNAALSAAALGARVVGVDAAPRLLEVARRRARVSAVEVDFREGDLLDLPVDEDFADVVLSVFGVVFASDPLRAFREIARVVRPGGRVLVSAWVPAGPIDAMLSAMGRVLGRVTQAAPPRRFGWSERAAVGALASESGLSLERTISGELAIRDSSPEAYVQGGQKHPMALSVRPVLEHAGAGAEAQAAMTAALREANEDPDGFLVHSPYVVHELRVG